MYDSPATLPIIQQLIYKYRNFLRFLTCSRHDINNNLIEQSQEPVNKASDCSLCEALIWCQSLWSLDLVPVSLKPWFGASLCEALIWCQSLWNLDLMPVSVKSWSGGICKILGENNNNILRHTISSTTYIYCHQSL
jgi:hypothetical protein